MKNITRLHKAIINMLSLFLMINVAGCARLEYRTKDGLLPNPKTVYACKIKAARDYPAKYKKGFTEGETVSSSKSCTKDGACTEISSSQGRDVHSYYDYKKEYRTTAFNLCMEYEGHELTAVEDEINFEDIFFKPEKELIPLDILLHPHVPGSDP